MADFLSVQNLRAGAPRRHLGRHKACAGPSAPRPSVALRVRAMRPWITRLRAADRVRLRGRTSEFHRHAAEEEPADGIVGADVGVLVTGVFLVEDRRLLVADVVDANAYGRVHRLDVIRERDVVIYLRAAAERRNGALIV